MSKIIASYLVRVTLHEPDRAADEGRELTPPTNERLEGVIKDALYDETPFYADEIGVSSERTDK